MYPHERSLVERLADKPFALLGVNSDQDLEQLKVRMQEESITWRSWRNGGSTSGPISTRWNVSGWPTIYLIDHEGVIRYKDVRAEALDAAIDELVAEAEVAAADDPMEIVESVLDEYDAAMQAFGAKYRGAETDEEREALFETDYPDAADFVAPLMQVVRAHPGTEAALTALNWVLGNAGGGVDMQEVYTLLRVHYMDSEELGDLCGVLARSPSPEGEQFLREVIEQNPHHGVVGRASYALAGMLGSMISLKGSLKTMTAEDLEANAEFYGKEYLEYVHNLDTAALNSRHIALLEKIVADFGDVSIGRRSLAEAAGGDLFEAQHLRVGKVAPDIEDVDLDGVNFKLSDYRGKVVLLDFWGDW